MEADEHNKTSAKLDARQLKGAHLAENFIETFAKLYHGGRKNSNAMSVAIVVDD